MFNRVADDTIDARGGVDLRNTVQVCEGACRHLPRSCLFTFDGGGEGEGAACAYRQHAADHALLAHAKADYVGVVATAFEKLHHDDVVGKRARRRDDLYKLRLVGPYAFKDAVEVLRGLEIVVRNHKGNAVAAELLQLFRRDHLGGLQFEIEQVKAGGSSFLQHL